MLGSRFLRALAVASVSVTALAGGAFAQSRNINIPAEDLKSALDDYISQSGVELVYKADDVSGLNSRAVRGAFTPEEALARLLQGTNITAQRGASGAFVVARQPRGSAIDPQAESLFTSNTIDTVVVTGSRVIQDAVNSPAPMAAMSAARLLATTPSNLPDALNKLPVFQGSSTQRNAGGASANNGGDFLNLRNFGQQRTLVLLDGMRVPASNANGSVDVSTLPQMLITRVDVVTGGASAVYGSDAITGVVNFVLDKNFDGVKYEANSGISSYGDGMSYKVGIAAGKDLFGGRGHLEGALQYYHYDGVLKRNRPEGAQNWASYGLGTAAWPITNIQQGRLNTESFGGKITCTSCTVNGQQFVSNGVIGPFNAGVVPIVNGNPSSVSIGGDGVFVDWTSAIGATRNAEAFSRFSYNLDDDTVFWIQGAATQASVFNYFFPSQIDNGRQTTNYFKNNPFLPAAAQAQLGNNGLSDSTNIFNIQEWYDAPNRVRETNSVTRNLTLSAGFDGQLFGTYGWNAHYTHGESRDSISGINNGNNQYHDAAQDAVIDTDGTLKCYNDTAAAIALYGDIYPGCVPLNPFGPNVTSDAAYQYWSRTTNFALTSIMDDIAADISGALLELPAGPIRVALSGEMRWLSYQVKSNASPTALVICTGLRLCGGPTPPQTLWDNNTVASVTASQNVWEFAAEAEIPILKAIPFVRSLDANLAGRYTDYSVSGAVQTWKAGLNWHVNGDVTFRGTTSIDIRAPTLNDLYAPTASTSIGYFDLLTNYAGTGTQQITQGNVNLVPEVARTYTVGMVLTPAFIPNLTASVDFYSINLHNAIGSVSGANTQVQALCNASGGISPFCALYVRPFPYTNITPANYPTAVYSRNLNSAFQATEGEDYEVDYHFNLADIAETWPGTVSLRALLNVAPKIDSNAFPGASITHTTNPKGHAALFADYAVGNWSVNTLFHWFSDMNKNGLLPPATPQVYAQNRVPSFSTVDVNVSRKITLDNRSVMQVYFSVQNIGNQTPPIVTGSSANPGAGIPTPAGEDVMGRYFTIGLRGNL